MFFMYSLAQNEFNSMSIDQKNDFIMSRSDNEIVKNINHYQSIIENLVEKESNPHVKKRLICSLAKIYQNNSRLLLSIDLYNHLLQDKKYNLSKREIIDVYIGLQNSYLKLGVFSKVIELNNKIDELIKKGYDYPIWSYNLKSRTYYGQKKYGKAAKRLKFELGLLSKNKARDSLIIPSGLNDLGFYYLLDKKFDQALFYFNKAYQRAKLSLYTTNINQYRELYVIIKLNIANLETQKGNYTEAKLIYENEVFNSNFQFKLIDLLFYKIRYCDVLIKIGLLKEVNKELFVIEKNKKLLSDKVILQFLKVKLNYYKKNKDYKNCSLLQDTIISKNDEIYNKFENNTYNSNELNCFFSQKEKEKLALKDQQTKNQRIFYIITIFALVVLLGVITFVYFVNKNKNLKIVEMNHSIQQSLLEKEILLKEIHHRVKNNLQIISGIIELQKINLNDKNAILALEEGQSRIRSISLVHQILYESKDFNNISAQELFDKLASAISKTVKSTQLDLVFTIVCKEIYLNLNTTIPLSLIVNELVTNSIKHGFVNKLNGNIVISLTKKDNEYYFKYSDNGVGYKEDMNKIECNSIGIDLIKGFSKQLEGNVEFVNNLGATVSINFRELKV